MFGMTMSPALVARAAAIQRLPKDRTFICFDTFGPGPLESWIEVVNFENGPGFGPGGWIGPPNYSLRIELVADDFKRALGRITSFKEQFAVALLLHHNYGLFLMSDVVLDHVHAKYEFPRQPYEHSVDQGRLVWLYQLKWSRAMNRGFARG